MTSKIKVMFLPASLLSIGPSDRLDNDQETKLTKEKGEILDEITKNLEENDRPQVVEVGYPLSIGKFMEILMKNPKILHFSGFAKGDSDYLPVQEVFPKMITAIKILGRTVRCIYLNGCYHENHVKVLAEHVDCVIGSDPIVMSYDAAKVFAAVFYEYIGRGQNLKVAFDAAGLVLSERFKISEEKVPKLKQSLTRPIDPSTIILKEDKVIIKDEPAQLSQSTEDLPKTEFILISWNKPSPPPPIYFIKSGGNAP